MIQLKSKDRVDLKAGDILTLYSSGGGGYGPPGERDPRLIADDVTQGYVSAVPAGHLYGRT